MLSAAFASYEPPPDGARQGVDKHHDGKRYGRDDADIGVVEEGDLRFEQHADTSGSNKSENGRSADIDLKGIERVGDEFRGDLREDSMSRLEDTGGACGCDGIHWSAVNRLNCVCEQLCDDTKREHEQCEEAGEGPDAEGACKECREDEVRDGPYEVEQVACDLVDPFVGRDGAAGHKGDGEREGCAEHAGREGDSNRFDHRGDELARNKVHRPRGKHPFEEAQHIGHPIIEDPEVEFGALDTPDQNNGRDGGADN